MIDEFTLAERNAWGLHRIAIEEPTIFQTYAAYRNDTTLSGPAEFFISAIRKQMERTHRAMTATQPHFSDDAKFLAESRASH